MRALREFIASIDDFTAENIQVQLKEFAAMKSLKLGELMMPIRAMVTGKTSSPSIFNIMAILGKDNILRRLYG